VTGSITRAQEIRALHFSLALTVLSACGAVVFSDSETMTLEAIPNVDVAVLSRSAPAKPPSV
jgi:hypothetical protein